MAAGRFETTRAMQSGKQEGDLERVALADRATLMKLTFGRFDEKDCQNFCTP